MTFCMRQTGGPVLRSRAAFVGALLLTLSGTAPARERGAERAGDEYPHSIMKEEQPRPAPRKRARGSASPSPVPPYRSTVTPPGRVPGIVETPPLGHPSAPPTIVPGVFGHAGPAIAPPRPPGQSFQDRAVNCVHSGSAAGVPPDQIGAFTRSCVNR